MTESIARTPRVSIRREVTWEMATPRSALDVAVVRDATWRAVAERYVAYSDATSISDLELVLMPVLTELAKGASALTAVLPVSMVSFHSALVRHFVARCRGVGVSPVLEVNGEWDRSSLALLLACQPDQIRLSPETIRGAGTVPQQFRGLVLLAEFANEHGIALVAPATDNARDAEALRIAGIGHFASPLRGAASSELDDELAFDVDPEPTVLRFPLRAGSMSGAAALRVEPTDS